MTAETNAASVTPAMSLQNRTGNGRPSTVDDDGLNQGMRVLSSLIAGVLLYGGLGWAGDHFLGAGFLLPTGIIAGAAVSCYVTVKRLTGSLPGTPASDSAVVGSSRTEGDVQ